MRSINVATDHNVTLHTCIWEPEGAPKGVVQIIHGVAEYIVRYDTFASFLTAQGYLVVGEDHPGHGQTAKNGNLGYLDGGWMGTVSGIHRVYETIREMYPSIPYYMLGHSMGSFLLRTYLFTYHTPIAGAIISGTGWLPGFILPLGLAVCKEESLRLGETANSPLLENMMFGGYNKKFAPNRTTHDWLSTDPEIVDAYVADPLCGFPTTIQLCREMMKGLRMIQKQDNLARMRKDLPVYFFAGQEDPVGDMGSGVMKCVNAFKNSGMKYVDWKLYPGMRHEALNEIGKEQVYQDLITWLEQN